jgi:quercetin dioxygenase-like cupin family protein
MSGSKVVQAGGGFRWRGVVVKEYKPAGEDFRGVTRQTLLGDGAGEEALSFLTRYFEVAPGGFTSLELHRHPHAVIVLRGRGEVTLGGETFALAPFDCVYVSPETAHQFRAGVEDPLGFLCMVDRERDRPRPAVTAPGPPPPGSGGSPPPPGGDLQR